MRWFTKKKTPEYELCDEGCGRHPLWCESCGKRIWYGKNSNYGLVDCMGHWCYDCNPFRPEEEAMTRPTWPEVYLGMAQTIAQRSTCTRLEVGCVITTADHRRVLAVGYNGNYAGGPNGCDSDEPGNCGCIHAEINALLKCDNTIRDKVVYVTTVPCKMCAKAIINAGASAVWYINEYRITEGRDLLRVAAIDVRRVGEDEVVI